MDPMKFTDEDKDQVVKFLNIVAKKAEFKMNTLEIIEYFKLLSFMQQKLLSKIEANTAEVLEVVEPKEASDGSG